MQLYAELIADFKHRPFDERWTVPFPMGVFGTLRQGWGNHWLMGRKKSKLVLPGEPTHCYEAHYKAFMPHFVAQGLSIHYSPGSSAVFEVFAYDPENWQKMIPRVDRLEGFLPEDAHNKRSWGYHRTLTWMQILPADFTHDQFDTANRWGGKRDLQIPVAEWKNYPKIPCWVYSSVAENVLSAEAKKSPVIWDGVTFVKERM